MVILGWMFSLAVAQWGFFFFFFKALNVPGGGVIQMLEMDAAFSLLGGGTDR